MTKKELWWEDIFSGNLQLGFNKNRIAELEEESFIYFKERNEEEHSEQTTK